jgi:hypothetical protein
LFVPELSLVEILILILMQLKINIEIDAVSVQSIEREAGALFCEMLTVKQWVCNMCMVPFKLKLLHVLLAYIGQVHGGISKVQVETDSQKLAEAIRANAPDLSVNGHLF